MGSLAAADLIALDSTTLAIASASERDFNNYNSKNESRLALNQLTIVQNSIPV